MRDRLPAVGGGLARSRRPSALRTLRRSLQCARKSRRGCQQFPAGESGELELEARADEILQSTVPAVSPTAPADEEYEDFGAADVEFARLQVLDVLDDDDAQDAPATQEPAPPPGRGADSAKEAEAAKAAAALKLAAAARAAAGLKAAASETPPAGARLADTVKPGEVAKTAGCHDTGSCRQSAGAAGGADARKPATPAPATPTSADEQEDGSLEFTLPPGELDRIFVEPAPRPAESAAPAAPAQGADPIRGEGAHNRIVGLEVAEDVRREMLAGMNEELLLRRFGFRRIGRCRSRCGWARRSCSRCCSARK